jgi:hypothetical protein
VSNVLDQLPTIIGVLVGSTATYLATSAAGRAQWQRQRQAHWNALQVAAYTDHAHAVKKMTEIARAVAAHLGLEDLAEPLSPEVGIPQLVAAELDRSAKWESVLMVGDAAVVEAGQRWKQCVWRLEWFARGRLSGRGDWDLALTQAGDAKHEFYEAVRRSIGTPGGPLPRFRRSPWISTELAARDSPTNSPASDEIASDSTLAA